jgi:membrane fusion protein
MSVNKLPGARLVTAARPTLFRSESIEARRMVWLGKPALALGLPAAAVSVASLALTVAMAALVVFGSYARRIELRGVILPSAGLIQVTSPAAGWVQSMAVHDGQAIRSGAPLYVINTDTTSTNGNTQQQILEALTRQRDSLIHQIARKVALRERQRADLQHRIENLQAQAEQANAQLAMREQFVRKVSKDHADFVRYEQQHLATIHEALGQQDNWMRAKGEYEQVKSEVLRVEGELLQAQAEQAANELESDNAIDAMRASVAQIDEQVANAEAHHLIELRAPGAGDVTAITVHPGQTVTSGTPLLTIVPLKNTMQAQLLAPSTAIGFLRPGERVSLRYSAFPYQKFGQYSGVVSEVSHAALQPEELRSLVPALSPSEQSKTLYRVIVTPDSQTVKVYGKQEPLRASMQVDASVLLETRPLYQWILQSLYDVRKVSP